MFAYEFGVLSAGSGLNIMGISQLAGIPVTSDPNCPVPAAQVCVCPFALVVLPCAHNI